MWSVLYIPTSGDYSLEIAQKRCESEAEAMQWVRENRFTGADDQKEYEFDLNESRVYLLSPDHRLQELNESDFP